MIHYIYFSGIPLLQYTLDPFIIFCNKFLNTGVPTVVVRVHFYFSYSLWIILYPWISLEKVVFASVQNGKSLDTGSQPYVLGMLPHCLKVLFFLPTLVHPIQLLFNWLNSSLFPSHLPSHPCLPPKPAYHPHFVLEHTPIKHQPDHEALMCNLISCPAQLRSHRASYLWGHDS